VPDPAAAVGFIERQGIATLYSASTEVPNLFYAYMSEPNPKVEAKWDSPSGHVYGWRWDLGRSSAAFYGALVAKKPTWVAWDVLPLVLGFAMERRHPESLYSDGLLSNEAIRVVRAFEGSDGVLSTKDLRQRAGFPTGKQERAAYLRAVEELDSKMLLGKTFDVGGTGDDMSHALVTIKYASYVKEAMSLSPEAALEMFLTKYLIQSIYFDPKLLAKHLRISGTVFGVVIDQLVTKGQAVCQDGLVITAL